MLEQRRHNRSECKKKCSLIFGDMQLSAMVENISFGGALVYFYSQQKGYAIGDICSISIYEDPVREYQGKVIRGDAYYIALQFMGMNTISTPTEFDQMSSTFKFAVFLFILLVNLVLIKFLFGK